jgi:DNA segregation ATPase FtsK/SpoIIIE, S-DNA-T family
MAYRGDDPAPLLPASLKAWLQGWLNRALGFVVLLCCAAAGASLLSWTAADPSITRATSSVTRNLLGSPGAIVADVIMQMTGLAGVFALLPPMFWALQLLTTGRPPVGLRFKLILAPLAVACLAAALSALPGTSEPPFHHGFGGLLGEAALVFVAGFLAKVNPGRASAAAGLFCFAGGTIVLMSSLGLTQRDLKLICQAGPRIRLPSLGGWWQKIGDIEWKRREPLFATQPVVPLDIVREPPPFESPRLPLIEETRDPWMPTPAADPDRPASGRGSGFDEMTEISSEEMAKRFAPGGGVALEPRLSPVSVAVDSAPDPVAPPFNPGVHRLDATWRRPSLGLLKRRPAIKGIERPQREKVLLRDLLESEAFRASDATLPLALGRHISDAPVIVDLARLPNLLVAGAADAERSVGINAMILSLVYRLLPDQCRFLMIAPSTPDLSVYSGMPHLLCPVVRDPREALAALDWIVAEMEERYRRMARLGVSNIDVYNNRAGKTHKRAGLRQASAPDADLGPLPYIVVVLAELGELMRVARQEIEIALLRLERQARGAGIHLIMATRRPTPDVVTAAIKKSLAARIGFRLASKTDSRAVFDDQGAEQLRGEGDMLYCNGSERLVRLQAPYVSDEEVRAVVAYLRHHTEPRYV